MECLAVFKNPSVRCVHLCVCVCLCGENFARILKCGLYFLPWRALFVAVYAASFFFFFNLP